MTLSDSISAKEFIVVDDEGRERARLGSRNGAVSLEMGAEGGANVILAVEGGGKTRLEFRSGTRTIRLLIDDNRAQMKLEDRDVREASCGFTLDSVGAWVYAEATPEIGARMLSNRGGEGSSVWLAEKRNDDGESIVHTRYLRPDPRDDSTGGWQSGQ